jgi:hypothetical protein
MREPGFGVCWLSTAAISAGVGGGLLGTLALARITDARPDASAW